MQVFDNNICKGKISLLNPLCPYKTDKYPRSARFNLVLYKWLLICPLTDVLLSFTWDFTSNWSFSKIHVQSTLELWISSYSYTTLGCYSSMQITVVIVLNLALLFFALNKPIDDFKNMQLLFTYTWHSHHSPATLLWKIWIQYTGKHVQHTGTIMKITLHVFTSWLSGRDHFWLGCEVDIFNCLSILTLLGVHSHLLFFSDWTCLQQKSRCLRILIHPHLYDKDTFISAIIIKKLNHKSITAD